MQTDRVSIKARRETKSNKLVLKIIPMVLVLMLGLVFMGEAEVSTGEKEIDTPIMVTPEIERELSSLEEIFAAFLRVSRDVKQFGYEIFQQLPDTFAPVTNVPVGADYILGPEDSLIIHIWGKVNLTYRVSLDRDGKIVLPKIGALYLWGLTFSEAQKLIRDSFSTFYSGIQIDISVGSLRTIKVFVLGDVEKPGAYNLSALSTILHSLYQTGGPTKKGTLREIKLIRNNRASLRTALLVFSTYFNPPKLQTTHLTT